jgi:hypothetical protein
MKSLLTVVAFAALAWWLQQQIAISRHEEKSTLDRLRQITKKAA